MTHERGENDNLNIAAVNELNQWFNIYNKFDFGGRFNSDDGIITRINSGYIDFYGSSERYGSLANAEHWREKLKSLDSETLKGIIFSGDKGGTYDGYNELSLFNKFGIHYDMTLSGEPRFDKPVYDRQKKLSIIEVPRFRVRTYTQFCITIDTRQKDFAKKVGSLINRLKQDEAEKQYAEAANNAYSP